MGASENNKRLYKHYLSIAPKKAKQAAILLKMFPELAEKKEPVGEKEVKKDGKKPKR